MQYREILILGFIPVSILLMIFSIKIFNSAKRDKKISMVNYLFGIYLSVFIPIFGFIAAKFLNRKD